MSVCDAAYLFTITFISTRSVDFIHQAFVCCLVSLCCCNKTKIHPRTNDCSDSYSVSDSVSDSGTRNSPCSYRQPDGNGQLVSRRCCKHSVWLFSCLVKKGAKKKKFFRHISLRARREHDTKARSHALTRAMRKKKDDVSPQGLEPWSTGVITFT